MNGIGRNCFLVRGPKIRIGAPLHITMKSMQNEEMCNFT